MKVISRQRNSKNCIICGLFNPYGVKASFYNMEDNSVISPFQFSEVHMSYPGRVHGGMISAMLDETALRAAWVNGDEVWGVTISLETKYRKPVPYGVPLFSRGMLISSTSNYIKSEAYICDTDGNILASTKGRYMKLNAENIFDVEHNNRAGYNEQDSVCEIDFPLNIK